MAETLKANKLAIFLTLGVVAILATLFFGVAYATGAPISHWAAEGDASDTTGLNNGALRPGTTTAPGKVGQAFLIDNNTDGVVVPSSASLSSYQDHTYSFWIKWLSVPHGGWEQILAKHAPGSDRAPGIWNCPTDTGSSTVRGIHWRMNTGNRGTSCLAPNGEGTNFNLSQWYHLAGVKEGNTLKLYIDGVQVGGTYSLINPFVQGAGKLYIGRSPSYAPVNALIDEVKLFGFALSAAEVQSEFQTGSESDGDGVPND